MPAVRTGEIKPGAVAGTAVREDLVEQNDLVQVARHSEKPSTVGATDLCAKLTELRLKDDGGHAEHSCTVLGSLCP